MYDDRLYSKKVKKFSGGVKIHAQKFMLHNYMKLAAYTRRVCPFFEVNCLKKILSNRDL